MKAKLKSASDEPIKRSRPALTDDARENQLINLAIDLAEKQLREGTASAQVITHYLKLGSSTERLEKQMKEEQQKLLAAKTEQLQSVKHIEELYSEALKAMSVYTGKVGESECEDIPN